MSVALAEHTGPWTADDIEALPDAGDHARFKVCDGGILVVTPAPGAGHRRASGRLHRALAHAATAARADAEVPGAVNVALPGGKLLVPAVVVVEAGAVAEMATRVPCEAVLAVVEVVSPPTVSIDRAVKPVMYAEAGIPVYWRVEQLQGTPKIVACSLSRGRYVTRTTLVAGTPGRITRPFAVGLGPLTSPAAPPESGRAKPERPLLLIWFLATFRAVTPQRVDGRKHAASVGLHSMMQEGRENARRADLRGSSRLAGRSGAALYLGDLCAATRVAGVAD